MRNLIAYKVGQVVHANGGNSQTGHELLCEKQSLQLAGHKTRGVRLPKNSMAADWPTEKFEQAVEKIYRKVRGSSREGNTWRQHMIALDKLLKPASQQPTGSAAMQQPHMMDVDMAPSGSADRHTGSPHLQYNPYEGG